jgi:hypothetical protein
MNEDQLFELYKTIKYGYDNSCWDSIQESMEIITEYIDIDEDFTE